MDVEKLLKDLKSYNPTIRRAASYKLINLKNPSTVPALIEAFFDEDFGVRRNAADALKGIQSEEAVDFLSSPYSIPIICPNCSHKSFEIVFTCQSCQKEFDPEAVGKLIHLQYIIQWLCDQKDSGLLKINTFSNLQRQARFEFKQTQTHLLPVEEIEEPERIIPAEEAFPQIQLLRAVLQRLQGWIDSGLIDLPSGIKLHQYLENQAKNLESQLPGFPPEFDVMEETQVIDFTLDSLDEWTTQAGLTAENKLREHLLNERSRLLEIPTQISKLEVVEPEVAPPPVEVIVPVKPAPAAKPKPMPEPKPKREPFDWGKLWSKVVDAFVSGAVLRGILFLGAFMIVVSIAVLTVTFFGDFPDWLQLIIMFAIPAIFYTIGWVVRSRLKLPQAGGVLTGIGAVLLGLVFGAIYQFGDVPIPRRAYWLISSVICTTAYIFTARALKGEFFGYVTAIGVISTVLSVAALLNLQLVWWASAVTLTSVGLIWGSKKLFEKEESWHDLGKALKRLPQFLIPGIMVAVFFIPGENSIGQFATFAIASIGYGLLATSFPMPAYAHACTWIAAGAVFLLVNGLNVSLEWTPSVGAALAFGHMVISRELENRKNKKFLKQGFGSASKITAIGLIVGSALGGIIVVLSMVWPSVLALSLVSVVVGIWSYWLKKPILTLLAASLFVVPFSFAIFTLIEAAGYQQLGILLMAGWNILAAVYLGLGMLLKRSKAYASWLQIISLGLTTFALFIALFIHYLLNPVGSVIPLLAVQGGTILLFVWFAWLLDSGKHPALDWLIYWLPKKHRSGFFLWPIGFLLPVLLTSSWPLTKVDLPWLGTSLCAIALGYVGLGQVLVKRDIAYRLPFHFTAYILPVIGIIISGGNSWALLSALSVSVLILVFAGTIYKRPIETSLAGVLFIWPFHLALLLSPLPSHSYSLAYAILASIVYFPIGLRLTKAGRGFSLPILILAYGQSAYGLLTSLLGRFGIYQENLLWVGVAVPLLITGQMIFSRYRFKHWAYAWAASLVFPIAFGQTLTWINIQENHLALAWSLLGFAYLGFNQSLERVKTKERIWVQGFSWPLFVTSIGFAVLGLALTISQTYDVFLASSTQIDSFRQESGPYVLAQTLTVLFFALSSFTHKTRITSHVASWLSILPLTVAGKLYSGMIFSTPLTSAEYSWLWLGWSAVLLGVGYATDKSKIRYSHGPYLASMLFGIFSLIWSASDRLTNIYTFGGLLLVWGLSQVLIQVKRHHAYEDFLNLFWSKPGTNVRKAMRAGFLFLVAYGFPAWLAQVLVYNEVSLPLRGLALALCAPIYIAVGMLLARVRKEYTWPMYSGGYALTAIGAMASFNDVKLTMYVLSLNAVVYAVSAYLFKQSFWLYLSTLLVPIISLLALNDHFGELPTAWVTGIFMGLAFLYLGLGQVFDRRAAIPKGQASEYAMPFYIPGFILSAVSLAVASAGGETNLAVYIFISGVLLYSLSAWIFKETIFIYPAAWLFAVPYYLIMRQTGLEPSWYGLGWTPLITAYILIGRYVFNKESLEIKGIQSFGKLLTQSFMPFYILAYALSVSMIVVSRGDLLPLVIALTSAAAIYFASSWIFRKVFWLYPGFLVAHLAAWFAYDLISPASLPSRFVVFPFVIFTCLIALIGYLVSRNSPGVTGEKEKRRVLKFLDYKIDLGRWSSLHYLKTSSWAQPMVIFALLDVILWQIIAFSGLDTLIITSTLFAFLLGLIAILWQDSLLIYLSLVLLLIGFNGSLGREQVVYPYSFAWSAGCGFAFYFIARIIDQLGKSLNSFEKRFSSWSSPLTQLSVILTGIATLGVIPVILTESTATAIALGFTGALYLAIAYRGRHQRLGYLGMGMLQVAWVLLLIRLDVTEPQLYAIPAGIYFGVIGYLERGQGNQVFGMIVEGFGLAVLLVTSFIQSIDPENGFIYFVLLLIEGLIVAWWGIFRQLRNPFFIGILATVVNVISQVILLINIYEVERWIIILGVGLLLVTGAIFIERRRETILTQTRVWRDKLEEWN